MSAKKTSTSSSSKGESNAAPSASTGAVGNMAWKLLSTGATLLATAAATKGANRGWRLMTGRNVPSKGDYSNTRTSDVVAYTALSSMLVTGARVMAERKAAEYYRESSGHLPRVLTEPSKDEKKAQKKLDKAAKKAEKSADKLRAKR